MIRILKYTLHDHGTAIQPLPRGAKVLHVGDQCGALQLWVQADDALPLEARQFATIYAGHDEVPARGVYIGTVILQGGSIVTHVFEIVSEAT